MLSMEQEYISLQREVIDKMLDFEMSLGYKPTYVKVDLDTYNLIRAISQMYCMYVSKGERQKEWLGMKLVCQPKLLGKYFIL